jgi:glucosamine-6-phosphate deaminase
LPVCSELVRLHREEGLSFRNVVTFNLDEYYPMDPQNPRSYVYFMHRHLFDHLDIDPVNIHIPDGTVKIDQVGDFCAGYEKRSVPAAGSIFSCWLSDVPGILVLMSPGRQVIRPPVWLSLTL